MDGNSEQRGTPDRPGSPPPRVLLAEDDTEMRNLLSGALHSAGYAVVECANGAELLDALMDLLQPGREIDIDVVVSDIRMPLVTGLDILEGTQGFLGFPPIVLITAFGDPKTHELAQRLGAAKLFDKPFEIDALLAEVRALIVRHARRV